MLSRSWGNRGWEKKCSVKYSWNESREDKAWAAVKAITYVLLLNLLLSANLSPFPYSAYWTHTWTQTHQDHWIAANGVNNDFSLLHVNTFKMWKINQGKYGILFSNRLCPLSGLCRFIHFPSQNTGEKCLHCKMATTARLFPLLATMTRWHRGGALWLLSCLSQPV